MGPKSALPIALEDSCPGGLELNMKSTMGMKAQSTITAGTK